MQYAHGAQSRLLPQKAWAASIPTLLTHQGFDAMCHPLPETNNLPPPKSTFHYCYSQLERFLGSIFMRRTICRVLEKDKPVEQGGNIVFNIETLQLKVSLDPSMQVC